MGDQKNDASGHAHGLPTLFAFHDPLFHAEGIWVIKHELGYIKAEFVLESVAPVFRLVPGEVPPYCAATIV